MEGGRVEITYTIAEKLLPLICAAVSCIKATIRNTAGRVTISVSQPRVEAARTAVVLGTCQARNGRERQLMA